MKNPADAIILKPKNEISQEFLDELTEKLADVFLGEKLPIDFVNGATGEIIIPMRRKITKTLLKKLAQKYKTAEIDPSPMRRIFQEIVAKMELKFSLSN